MTTEEIINQLDMCEHYLRSIDAGYVASAYDINQIISAIQALRAVVADIALRITAIESECRVRKLDK